MVAVANILSLLFVSNENVTMRTNCLMYYNVGKRRTFEEKRGVHIYTI